MNPLCGHRNAVVTKLDLLSVSVKYLDAVEKKDLFDPKFKWKTFIFG